MLKLASTQIHFVLATVATLALAACGGGEDDDGGNNNTGGSGGGGGSGTGSSVLVSDFDTPNNDNAYDGYSENMALGWRIAWFTYSDKSAGSMIFPTEGGAFQATMDASRGAGEYVAKTNGSGFGKWGAGMGFNFAVNGPMMKPSTVDLSAYKGIRFMMKVTNPSLNGNVSVKLVDFDHAEVVNGGGCVVKPELAALGDCNNNFALVLTNGSSEWKQFNVAFTEMTRDTSWGQQYPMDLKETIGFQFQVQMNATFDFAVDEFELTK